MTRPAVGFHETPVDDPRVIGDRRAVCREQHGGRTFAEFAQTRVVPLQQRRYAACLTAIDLQTRVRRVVGQQVVADEDRAGLLVGDPHMARRMSGPMLDEQPVVPGLIGGFVQRCEVGRAPLEVSVHEVLHQRVVEPQRTEELPAGLLRVEVRHDRDVDGMEEDFAGRERLEPERPAEVIGVDVGHEDPLHIGRPQAFGPQRFGEQLTTFR